MSITINKKYISKKNTNSARNNPKYIVIHETDNFRRGANAECHAKAQYSGHLNTSVHFYCGSDGVYQASAYESSCWSIGNNYNAVHSITDATNYNVISIEICVNEDGDYNVARANAIELVKFLMGDLGITVDKVIRHFDAKGKYCPRKMLDNPSLWEDFKAQIGNPSTTPTVNPEPTPISTYYRVGKSWNNGICVGQIGAFKSLDNAKNACKTGYTVFDDKGNAIYPTSKPSIIQPIIDIIKPNPQNAIIKNSRVLSWQKAMNKGFDTSVLAEDGAFGSGSQAFADTHQLHKGISGCPTAVKWLQTRLNELGYYHGYIDGKFGNGTDTAIKAFQNARGLKADGWVGVLTTKELLK